MLVVVAVALASVLLIGSAPLVRTSIALGRVGPGFDTHNVLTIRRDRRWLARLTKVFPFGVTAGDPMVFSGVPIVLALVAMFAVWLPARRASRVDPVIEV